jgi:hypothetical protein
MSVWAATRARLQARVQSLGRPARLPQSRQGIPHLYEATAYYKVVGMPGLSVACSKNARSVPTMDVPGPPVEAGRRVDQVLLPLKRDTALGLCVF